VRRESTVAQARVHIRQIVAEFGSMPLTALRPSQVKSWVAKLHGKATAEYRPFQGADYP